MDHEIARQNDEQRALGEKSLFEQWLKYPLWEPNDAAILLECREPPEEAWSYGRKETEDSIFDLLLHFRRCGLIDILDGNTWDGLEVHGKAMPPAVWIEAYLDFPGNIPLPFEPPPVPPPPETTQTITGPTFARLQAALEAFDPNNPPRSKKAFMGVLESQGCDTREQVVFADIAAEHYGHSWRS
jgi:hypothetical protein